MVFLLVAQLQIHINIKHAELTTIPACSCALTVFELLLFHKIRQKKQDWRLNIMGQFASYPHMVSYGWTEQTTESLRWLVSWSGLDLHGSFLCPFWRWSCHTSGWTKPSWWLVPLRIASIFAPGLALQRGVAMIESWRLAMMNDAVGLSKFYHFSNIFLVSKCFGLSDFNQHCNCWWCDSYDGQNPHLLVWLMCIMSITITPCIYTYGIIFIYIYLYLCFSYCL